MGIRRYHVERKGVHEEQIGAKVIEYVLDIPMMMEAATPAADSIVTAIIYRSMIRLTSQHLKHMKSAKFIYDYTWAATADGTIQLYDATADVVIAESPTKTGGEASNWEETDVTGALVAGNGLRVHVNITVAGATGETVTLRRAYLRLICGVS